MFQSFSEPFRAILRHSEPFRAIQIHSDPFSPIQSISDPFSPIQTNSVSFKPLCSHVFLGIGNDVLELMDVEFKDQMAFFYTFWNHNRGASAGFVII